MRQCVCVCVWICLTVVVQASVTHTSNDNNRDITQPTGMPKRSLEYETCTRLVGCIILYMSVLSVRIMMCVCGYERVSACVC